MAKIAKNKIFNGFVVMTTILWAVGIAGVLAPLFPASAAVTVLTENRINNTSEMISAGMIRDVAAFKITASASETLNSIKVRFTDIGNSGATPANTLAVFNATGADGATVNQGLSVWKDNNSNGWIEYSGTSADTALPWEVQPTWTDSGGGNFDTTLDFTNQALASSYAGSWNYFVIMKIAATPAAGRTFKLSFLTGIGNAIVTSGTSPSITTLNTGSLISMGSSGGYMTPPHVISVNYIDYKTIVVNFDTALNPSTATCDDGAVLGSCVKYTLSTSAVGDNEAIVLATLSNTDTTLTLTAHANARISAKPIDTIKISNDPLLAIKSASGGFYMDTWPLVPQAAIPSIRISEIKVSDATFQTNEFIELYNYTPVSVNLATGPYKVKALRNNSIVTLATLSGTMAAGKYFLLANNANNYHLNVNGAGLAADATFTGVDLQNNDTVFLTKTISGNDVVQDMVGFGAATKVYEMNAGPQIENNLSIERRAKWSSSQGSMTTGEDVNMGNAYDSNDNSYDFIVRNTAPDPQKSSSPAEIGQALSNLAPIITFSPVVSAVSGVELKIAAKIEDMDSVFQLTTKLCYKASNVSWPGTPTCVDGLKMTDYIFTIPSSAVTTAGIDYYIYVTDSTSLSTYTPGTSAVTAQLAPHKVNVSATAGSRQISGTVYELNCTTTIANAAVKVDGTGYSAITNASGVFIINSVPDGVYNLKANVGGYVETTLWGVGVNINNPVSSGWNFCLSTSSGSKDGTGGNVGVSWTAPNNGMSGAPLQIQLASSPILVGLNFNSDTSSISTSTVLLKKIVGGITASVVGYSVCVDPGTCSGSFGGTTEKNVIVISSNAPLDGQSEYIVELLPTITSTGKVSISGNRPGGGHMLGFSTSSASAASFGGGAGFGFSVNEASWQTNSFSSMTSDAGFMDMQSKFSASTGKWEGGQYKPPFILGMTPTPGTSNAPLNLQSIILKFNEPMDSVTVNRGTFLLYTVNISTGAETDVTVAKLISASLDSVSKQYVTLLVSGSLTASTTYRVKVKNGVRSSAGLTLGPPSDPGAVFYKSDFVTGAANDSTAPSILSSYPADNATNVSQDFGYINIQLSEAIKPTNINSSSVMLTAGQSSVPATIDYDPMSQKISIYPSTGLIPGTKYTVQLSFGGSTGLTDLAGLPAGSTTSTINFTMGTTADVTKPKVEFVNCDNYSCAVTFSKSMSATKSSEASVNANLWAKSVLKPGNYALTFGPAGTGTSVNLTAASVSFNYKPESNTVMIEGLTYTGVTLGTDLFIMTVTGVQDMMSNPIDTASSANVGKGNVKNKANTMGFIGPGGGGNMMGSGEGMGVSTGGPTGFGAFKPSEAMMGGAMVMPMNMLAEKTTTYIFDVPKMPGKTTDKLDDGGYIKLTFEKGKGFDLSNAEADSNNPAKNDLNWDGPSTVKLKTNATGDTSSDSTKGATANDGIVVSSANTLIAYLDTNAGTTGAPDRFHLEIKGIVNPNVTQSLTSSGYTIDEKLYKADGTLVDTITSMPFFINSAGANSIVVNVTATDGSGTFKLMMGSPSAGPMDATVTIAAGTGTQTWTGLPNGCYHIFTEPTITLGANKYSGQMNPEPVCLPGTGAFWNSGTSTYTKALAFAKYGAGNSAQLAVKVSGAFKAAGEDIDVFAGGPSGFAVETKTLTGAVTNNSTTVYLPSNGNYMVGIGPAMPKGPKMGPVPMSDWMPPKSINIEVSGVGGTPIIKRTDTGATITELSFTVNAASKQINGRLISKQTTLSADYSANATSITVASATGFTSGDYITLYNGTTASGAKVSSISGTTINLTNGVSTAYSAGAKVYNVVPDTNVWANQPMGFGGAGSNATSNTDGSFTLKVSSNGNYDVSAWKNGMGEAPMRSITVKDNNAGTSDGNSTADIYADGAIVTGNAELLIKMFRPEYTVSGKVMDSSSNPIQYTHLMAQETTSKQTTHGDTNSSGDYVLNVSAGTWVISGSMPSSTDACGALTKTVIVSASTGSLTLQNISPSSSTCYSITGSITLNGVAQGNIPVMINAWDTTNDRPLGTYFRNEMTDTAGGYQVKVANGTYKVEIFTPDFGQLGQNVTVNGADATSNISYAANAMKTLTVAFTGGTATQRGFIDVKSTTSSTRRGVPLNSLASSQTISMPAGIYSVKVFVEGLGDFSPASNVDMSTANQTVTINISGQTTSVVSGTVLDASNNPIANTAIILANTTDGTTTQTTTDSNGDYSTTVKDGNYNISAGNKDYSSPAKAAITVSGATNYDFDTNTTDETVAAVNALTEKTLTITGTIYENNGSTPLTKGYVLASTSDGKKSKADIQSDGTYSMPISAGTWTIVADAPLFSATTRGTTVEITTTAATSKDVTLTADAADVKKSDSNTVSPAGGVSIDDTDNTGIEFSAGQGVLGRATTATVSMEEVDMPATDMGTPVGSFVDITANASGTDINQLTGDGAEITIPYTTAQMTAAGVTSETAIVPAYYDETTSAFVPFSNYSCDRTANTCTATTTHLTAIGVIAVPLVAAGRRTTADAPSSGAGATAPVTAVPVIKVETKADDKAKTEVKETKVEVTEAKETVKEVVKAVTKAVTQKVVIFKNVLPTLPTERVLSKETSAIKEAAKLISKAPTTEKDWKVVNYLAYGTTDKVKAMPTIERKALLDDYKKIYNKLPNSEKEWTDVAKIAEGVTPSRVLSQEAAAIKTFVKVFGRAVDFKNIADEKFVHSVAYNLRPETKDSAKEKAAVAQVQKTLKQTPTGSYLWNVVNAIAYSGVEAKKVSSPSVEKKTAEKPVSEAPKSVETIANAVPTQPIAAERNLKAELSATADYTKISGKAPSGEGWKVVQFISYGGSDASKDKTASERTTIVKQYKSKFGKLPASEADWQKLAQLVK